jgi:hypothetical protein
MAINFKELGMKEWLMVILFFAFVGFSTSSKESVRVGIKIYFKC